MVQQGKELSAKPDNLSSIPGTHIVEGKGELLRKVILHT